MEWDFMVEYLMVVSSLRAKRTRICGTYPRFCHTAQRHGTQGKKTCTFLVDGHPEIQSHPIGTPI
ncbi:MAG: hypothetical protein CSA33_07900 [Desulfobulbus propionicus]|nr:MAG: hypothetical protein CSA33_07900 [Desulfobulbus propionicus]